MLLPQLGAQRIEGMHCTRQCLAHPMWVTRIDMEPCWGTCERGKLQCAQPRGVRQQPGRRRAPVQCDAPRTTNAGHNALTCVHTLRAAGDIVLPADGTATFHWAHSRKVLLAQQRTSLVGECMGDACPDRCRRHRSQYLLTSSEFRNATTCWHELASCMPHEKYCYG